MVLVVQFDSYLVSLDIKFNFRVIAVLPFGSCDAILFSYLVLLIIEIIGIDLAIEVFVLDLPAQTSLAGA